MKKLNKLVVKCISYGFDVGVSYCEGDTKYAVSIKSVEKSFSSWGHATLKKAIKAGLAFMRDYEREPAFSLSPKLKLRRKDVRALE